MGSAEIKTTGQPADDSQRAARKVFIDTEFTDFERPRLLSLGLVAEGGLELYVELAVGTLRGISTFVADTVLPQFGLVPQQVESLEQAGRLVGAWLGELGTPIDVHYDFHTDFDLLEGALKSAALWVNLEGVLRPTHVGYLVDQEDGIEASEKSWAKSLATDGIDRHHALADARALREAYAAVHGEPKLNEPGMPPADHDYSIAPEDADWLDGQVNRLVALIADTDPDEGAPDGAPIVLLDVDDVFVLPNPYGGVDAVAAVRAERADANEVFELLAHRPAVQVLRQVHEALDGHVRYVITSTWRTQLNRSEFAEVMRRAGLPFVAERMERRHRWATPDLSGDGRTRLHEVKEWLRLHHAGEPFAVIDDTWSGSSMRAAGTSRGDTLHGRVVLCDQSIGLLPAHTAQILSALTAPP